MSLRYLVICIGAMAGLLATARAEEVQPIDETRPASDAVKLEFFEKKVRPLLVDNCYNCHSASTNAKGGLRVDDRKGLLDGGGSGAAVIPGDPDGSLLIKAVQYDGLEMPPKKRLSAEQIADLKTWVKDGAAWPKTEVTVEIGRPNEKYERLKKEHWAWQPLRRESPPEVQATDWARGDVDRFLLARLESEGLSPAADADKTTLLRRITFDLTGLPPTTADLDAFLADKSQTAFEAVVDRLLASPAFGERWGRHWLDVARYGESTGSSRNVPYPHAWRYRDYVIRAFNNDKPFDQFVREQIAGDLLPANSDADRDEHVVATGFLALGVKDVNQRFKIRFTMDNIDEQIDTVTRAILGVTASCARCHDHKFDPIPTTEYYALAGIFHSTDLCAGVRNKMGGGGLDYYDASALIRIGRETAPDEAKRSEIETLKQSVAKAKSDFEALRDSPEGAELAPNGKPKRQVARQHWNKLQQELNALSDPAAHGEVVLGVRDAQKPADTELRIRGEAEKTGPVIPRGFLTLVHVPNAAPVDPAHSGRLQLAAWLTDPKNALTSRVAVNRVWQQLFGRGIVASVDNFGVNGVRPTHPELLDYLAGRFSAEGWSVKKLIRDLVLSHAYQLSSAVSDEHLAKDPANYLLGRHSPRRLSAEELRDAALAASGRINLKPPTGSPADKLKVIEIRNNGNEAKQINEAARATLHRSIYLPLLRGLTPTSLEVFDFAEQGMVTGTREVTTVPTQALYLLNDPFVRCESLALAESLLAKKDLSPELRITEAYRRTIGREPTAAEITQVLKFVGEYAELVTEAPAEKLPAKEAGALKPEEAATPAATAETPAKPTPVIDPDQVVLADVAVSEEFVRASTAEAAAWAAFCQAILGTAEFRYLR